MLLTFQAPCCFAAVILFKSWVPSGGAYLASCLAIIGLALLVQASGFAAQWGMGVVLCRRSLSILPAECKYRVLKAGLSVVGGLSSTCVVRAGSQGTHLAAGGALGCAAVVAS